MLAYRTRTPGIHVNDLSFADVVRSSNRKEFVFDAYGQRSLIFFPLTHHQVNNTDKSTIRFTTRQDALQLAHTTAKLAVLAHFGL